MYKLNDEVEFLMCVTLYELILILTTVIPLQFVGHSMLTLAFIGRLSYKVIPSTGNKFKY